MPARAGRRAQPGDPPFEDSGQRPAHNGDQQQQLQQPPQGGGGGGGGHDQAAMGRGLQREGSEASDAVSKPRPAERMGSSAGSTKGSAAPHRGGNTGCSSDIPPEVVKEVHDIQVHLCPIRRAPAHPHPPSSHHPPLSPVDPITSQHTASECTIRSFCDVVQKFQGLRIARAMLGFAMWRTLLDCVAPHF